MGYIMVATNKGLSRFDVKENSFKNYYNYNIFPFSGLKEHSLYVTRSKELVIGSLNGMVIVDEQELDVEVKEFPVNLSQLYINNSVVKPDDDTQILRKAIEFTDTIELYENKHTVFSIDFSVSNYIKAIHPVIHYKLEGFNNEWIPASTNDKITYTNLSPGKYKHQF